MDLEVLHWSGARTQNTGTPRTSEHRQLKSHGNSLNCHGKVMEKSWNCIIRFLWEPWYMFFSIRSVQLCCPLLADLGRCVPAVSRPQGGSTCLSGSEGKGNRVPDDQPRSYGSYPYSRKGRALYVSVMKAPSHSVSFTSFVTTYRQSDNSSIELMFLCVQTNVK